MTQGRIRRMATYGIAGFLGLGLWLFAGTPAALGAAETQAAQAGYVPLQKGAVTFNKDIAPIIFENCTSCHRPGEVAPFSLMNYQDVKKRAKLIHLVTETRAMPPWKADEGAEKFHDARRLSEAQIGLIKQWNDEGAIEGKAEDLPPLPKFNSEWTLGQPDAVFEPAEAYPLGAEGEDIYRCFVVPSNTTEDRYVSAMEVRPDNKVAVHHVIVYLDTSGKAREKDAADPAPGYTSFGGPGFNAVGTLGGWAPGNLPRRLPEGVGIHLPKGADIVLQVHYHRTGKPETDRTKIGVYFTEGPVDKQMRVFPLVALPLRIPAGEKNYEAKAALPVPADVTVLGVMPHMHLVARDMTVNATLPDGTKQKMVSVPDWDFNWQTTYYFKEPVKLPAGTWLNLVAHYDNSADNPRNPNNPPKQVTWGEETTDEMCIAFFFYTVNSEHLTKGAPILGMPNSFGGGGGGLKLVEQLLKRFDKNGNGKLEEDERAEARKAVQGLLGGG